MNPSGDGTRPAAGPPLSAVRDAFVKFWSVAHEAAYRATDGEILNRLLGMPVVELTTTGRRTGQRRSTMLTAPILDRDRIVLVASNGGDSRDPQWYRNVLADPEVAVTRGGVERPMRARVAEPSERPALWDEIRGVTPIYEMYQRRTRRQIPLVLLEMPGAGTKG